MMLDIGCGARAQGDVNLDLFVKSEFHRSGDRVGDKRVTIDPKRIKNFVLGHALHLPFRDHCIETVYSHHVIEHIADPFRFLYECVRVASRKVIIICPHRYAKNQPKSHIHFFGGRSFSEVLRQFDFEIAVSQFTYFPHTFFPLIRYPSELTVTVYL